MSSTADDQTQSNDKLTRRQMLGRTAAAGAVVWSAPLILSSTAHAAGTLGGNVCGEDGNERPDWVKFRYVPNQWIWDACVDPSLNPDQLPDTRSTPPAEGASGPASVTIRFTGAGVDCVATCVPANAEVVVSDTGSGQPDMTVEFFNCGDDPAVAVPIASISSIHMSCSQPLCVGDTYGWLLNVEGGKAPIPPSPHPINCA